MQTRLPAIVPVRAGRSPESLVKEVEPNAQTIRNWAGQAHRGGGLRTDGLTTDEGTELTRLRRERETLSHGETW